MSVVIRFGYFEFSLDFLWSRQRMKSIWNRTQEISWNIQLFVIKYNENQKLDRSRGQNTGSEKIRELIQEKGEKKCKC
jgi:hypothetical protein